MGRKRQAKPQWWGAVGVRRRGMQMHIDDKLSSAILSICVKRNCQQEYSNKNETHSHRPSPAFPTDLVGRAALAGLTSRLPLPARAIFRCHPETMAESAKAECRVSPNPTSTLHYFGST